MPLNPFNPAVTLDELWKNILFDLGQTVTPLGPTDMKAILVGLDNGLYGSAASIYGPATDGTLNFISSGSATVAGATLSSGVYTMTRDIFAGNGTIIASGSTIKTAGFRFFCAGNLVNNGVIQSNGNAASANTAGAALSYSGTISNTTVGSAGAAGTTSTTANNGTNQTVCLGGVGGAGGTSASGANAGGTGGTVTAPAATIKLPYTSFLATVGRGETGAGAAQLLTAGTGGGSGAGDGTNLSGGGGGGAGIVVVVAQTITGTGSITATGGAGGAANATGNSGGGGGGGGGLVIVVSSSVISAAVNSAGPLIAGQTITANGGAGGAGTGTGTAGNSLTAPLVGTIILLTE